MSNYHYYHSDQAKEKVIKIRKIHSNTPESRDTALEDEQSNLQSKVEATYRELEEIKTQQQNLIEATNNEVAAAKESWKQEKVKLVQQAHQEGYDNGFSLGKEESIEQYRGLLEKANRIIESATADYHATIEQSEESILELSIRISEKIIKCELDEKPELYTSIVKAAIKEIKDQSNLSLYVHPDSYELVSQQKEEIASLVDRDVNLSVYVKEDLSEGSCLIEHPFGRIDAGIDAQLEEIRSALHDISLENH
ncbi:flagellar assembly protein FliH [Virgibacillus kekensis]|uniref:Flagellar assembly protein FliH n=1 Tax=Virgibacillus kekensis TaxID=202261 RepID=A0ABV9DGJ8_9BACI